MKGHPMEGVRDLLSLFADKLRVWALLILCRSFKPAVELAYLEENLKFDSKEELVKFLTSVGATTDDQKKKLLVKESKQAIAESKLLQGGFK